MATYGMVAGSVVLVAGPRLMVAGGPEVGLVDGQRSALKMERPTWVLEQGLPR